MNLNMKLVDGSCEDGVAIRSTDEGLVELSTTFKGARLKACMTHLEANDLVDLLWRSTLEAKEQFGGG